MELREQIIRQWFSMWLEQRDTGMEAVFAPDAVYIESWGPEYHGTDKIRLWFEEWNRRGRVVVWDIKGVLHGADQTMVEWYFKSNMKDGTVDEFDGVSLLRWTEEGKIARLQEFGCNLNRYDPYEHGTIPQFQNNEIRWF